MTAFGASEERGHTYTEDFRRECEARFWLVHTGGKPEAVDALMVAIRKKRGAKAVEILREEMRKQYQLQRAAKKAANGAPTV